MKRFVEVDEKATEEQGKFDKERIVLIRASKQSLYGIPIEKAKILFDLISQVPEIREKLAECLYMSKAQRDCAEKFFKEKLVHWKDLEIREKNWDIIKDYWYALADSILQLFKEV
jgi:DNA polymerase elongation subunit (family B)